MGRKPMSGEAKTSPLLVRLNVDERAAIESAADAAGKPASTWARDVLLAAAGDARPAAKKATRKRAK